MSWVDKTPIGRLLNRFTADFDEIDSDLLVDITLCMYNVLTVASVIVAG